MGLAQMEETDFIHLRLHTEYSVVDGLIRVKPLFEACAQAKMQSIAVTDHTNLFAAIKVYTAALSRGIKPIFGCDLLCRGEDDVNISITLLCLNNAGYHQLTQLISQAYLTSERINGIPEIPVTWLTAETTSDLLMLSGGIDGDIGQLLLADKLEAAKQRLQHWQTLFLGRFYIELQRVGLPQEDVYIQAAVRLASEAGVPVVATHSVRFLKPEDFYAHEVRVAVHDGYVLDDPKRPKRYTAEQYLASPQQMAERFVDIPEALANAVEIAKRCNVTFELGKAYLPNFPVPQNTTVEDYLRTLSVAGLEKRMSHILANTDQSADTVRQTYAARLKTELDVIIEMGFPGYFLIVADFIRWAKENGVPVGPGRGSGAGSLVAYALEITDIDPLPYDLLFERFLNPERVSMPDFDIDFCIDGRDRVIDYVAQKYGRDAVSQIITYGSMAAKAVIRDVGRVLGLPYGFVDGVAKLVPMDLGMTLAKALEEEPQLKARYDTDEEVAALIDMGLKLEGTVRNVGKHAGGVVIAPSKLTDFTPIYCEEGSQQLVSQYDKNDIEAVGLVKFDFLGLRNLTIIDHAVKTVNTLRQQHQEPLLAINDIPLDDPATFHVLQEANTTAIFQLESRGMKDLIKRLHPDSFEDIIALVALFRPGPLQSGMVDDFIDRKHGRAKVIYPHPLTEAILKPTYGIILYQEQVMMLAQVLAGYTLGGADMLRRAMGKKKPEEMAKQRKIFVTGAVNNNIEEKTATYIFDLMEKFAGYGFNKSHSAAYAYVSYQTAWLKANYPAAFMAAVLSSDMNNTDKMVNFVDDAKAQGIIIEPPDINTSDIHFTVSMVPPSPIDGRGAGGESVTNDKVKFGLGAIKGAGESALECIIEERKANGPFADLFSFCCRIDSRKVNKRVIEALIYSGAMDSIGPDRAILLAALGPAMHSAEQQAQNASVGQDDLFGEALRTGHHDADNVYAGTQALPMTVQQMLIHEKEALGLFLTGHPMATVQADCERLKLTTIKRLRPTKRGNTQSFAGVVLQKRRLKTKRGDIMQILTLDDGDARIDLTVFPEQAELYKRILMVDAMLVIEAEISHDTYTDGLRAVAKTIRTFDEARLSQVSAIQLTFSAKKVNERFWQQMHTILQDYKGECPIDLSYQNALASAKIRLGEEWKVTPIAQCMSALNDLCDAVNLEYK